MSAYVLFGLLGVALALWGLGLWRRGTFSAQTSPVERRAYVVRVALWILSILIVSWPLQIYRSAIGDVAYVITALSILALFFWLGSIVTKILLNRSQAQRDGA